MNIYKRRLHLPFISKDVEMIFCKKNGFDKPKNRPKKEKPATSAGLMELERTGRPIIIL